MPDEEVFEGPEETPEDEGQEEEVHDDSTRAVSSTMVGSIGFNRESGELLVDFVNGHSESYPISPDQWEEVKQAPSVGQWMHQNVL